MKTTKVRRVLLHHRRMAQCDIVWAFPEEGRLFRLRLAERQFEVTLEDAYEGSATQLQQAFNGALTVERSRLNAGRRGVVLRDAVLSRTWVIPSEGLLVRWFFEGNSFDASIEDSPENAENAFQLLGALNLLEISDEPPPKPLPVTDARRILDEAWAASRSRPGRARVAKD